MINDDDSCVIIIDDEVYMLRPDSQPLTCFEAGRPALKQVSTEAEGRHPFSISIFCFSFSTFQFLL